MDGLMAFLRDRLGEDEEWAHAARSGYVLRWLAAGRAILDLHEVRSEPALWGVSAGARSGQPTGDTSYWCGTCDHDRDYGHIGSPAEGCDTLRHLAAAWSGHPDYRQEWAPGA